MNRGARWCWAVLSLCACRDEPATHPSAPSPAPAPQPTAATPPAAPAPSAPNPCDSPGPVTLELQAGTTTRTPWDLEFKYAIDDDKKLGPGYLFQLRSGERRWETRRDNRTWTKPITWRGFCWRGAERPPRRALQLKIEVGPVCKDGRLQELGGCGTTFGAS